MSGQQVQQAMGKDEVTKLAQKAGVSSDDASKGLAALLPEVVNKLTPDGKLPSGDQLGRLLGGLKGLLPK